MIEAPDVARKFASSGRLETRSGLRDMQVPQTPLATRLKPCKLVVARAGEADMQQAFLAAPVLSTAFPAGTVVPGRILADPGAA
jgi:hypothetical protein